MQADLKASLKASAALEDKKVGKHLCVIKFYADTPNGERNKLFSWQVKDWTQAQDCIIKFLRRRFTIHAAYFNIPAIRKSIRIPLGVLDADVALSTE